MDNDTKSELPRMSCGVQSGGGGVPLLPIFILVLWLFCLTVGALGFVLPYARPKVICFCQTEVEVQKIEADLVEKEPPPPQPLADSAPPPPPDAMIPPTLPQPSSPVMLATPSAPVVVAVAPSPAVAFALPVVNPTRIAKVSTAASARVSASRPVPAAAPMAPQQLTFGRGEGAQPSPGYPETARRQGQEGVVVVRLTVSPEGKVTSAEPFVPCPWPLLNSEAVRTVKRRWTFPPGSIRLYEVAIRFELSKK